MDDVTTGIRRELLALVERHICVRFRPIDIILASVTVWPLPGYVVALLTTYSSRRGEWDGVLTIRDRLISYLQETPERAEPVLAGLRALVDAGHPCAVLLSDQETLSVFTLPAVTRVTTPQLDGRLLNGHLSPHSIP